MSVKIESLNDGPSLDVDEEFEEPDLTFDEQTHPAASPPCKELSQMRVHGLIDIILHPTYQVPCPYIRLFENSGQPITDSIYQSLIRKKNVRGNGERNYKFERGKIELLASDDCCEDFDDVEDLDDQPSVYYEVIYEEHPYLQIPCLCVHVCGLLPRIELLESNGQSMKSTFSAQGCQTNNNLNTDSLPCTAATTTSNSIDSYFLHWLVLMGPTIGLEIATDLYKDILMMNSL
jgi:Autophagocytosis associated protein, active-site domain